MSFLGDVVIVVLLCVVLRMYCLFVVVYCLSFVGRWCLLLVCLFVVRG